MKRITMAAMLLLLFTFSVLAQSGYRVQERRASKLSVALLKSYIAKTTIRGQKPDVIYMTHAAANLIGGDAYGLVDTVAVTDIPGNSFWLLHRDHPRDRRYNVHVRINSKSSHAVGQQYGAQWIRVCVGKGASADFAEVVPCGPRTQEFDFLLGNDGTVHWKRKSFEWEVGK
jgi:hypothetical protein